MKRNNQEELMIDIRKGLDISFANKEKSEKASKLFSYFETNKNDIICH